MVFSKAFDRVPHKWLIHKLDHLSMGFTALLDTIFLENSSQQVLLDGQESFPVEVTSGVPQETVLAPLLFLCTSLIELNLK